MVSAVWRWEGASAGKQLLRVAVFWRRLAASASCCSAQILPPPPPEIVISGPVPVFKRLTRTKIGLLRLRRAGVLGLRLQQRGAQARPSKIQHQITLNSHPLTAFECPMLAGALFSPPASFLTQAAPPPPAAAQTAPLKKPRTAFNFYSDAVRPGAKEKHPRADQKVKPFRFLLEHRGRRLATICASFSYPT